MALCEEDDDFSLLGDGDGHGDNADGVADGEKARSSTSKGKARESAFSLSKKRHKEEDFERDHGSGKRSGSGSGDVFRKDREEWSDGAIEALLDAYTHRYDLLNRGNLRGRDWEDVAAAVNLTLNPHLIGNSTGNTASNNRKTVEQCKNKIDNLKKRFKVECHRISSSASSSGSHWPWFAKLHVIVTNPPSSSSASHANHSRSRTSSPLPIPVHNPNPNPNPNTIPLGDNVNDDEASPSVSVAAAPGSGSVSGRHSKRHAAVAALAQVAMRAYPVPRYKWKRVLLKVSGAALAAASASAAISASPVSAPHNVDPKVVMLIAREIQVASRQGIQVAVVVGGRNIFCGESWIAATAVDRAATYQICMMASIMNAMLLQASLEKIGVSTRVQTNLTMQEVAEPYVRRKAISHLEKGRVVIFGGIASGLGNPLFTTDAAAALRASEINADAVLKGSTGDALYSCYPGGNNVPGFEHISYREFVSRGFTPMDTTAIAFCEENNIPVVLFNMLESGNISRAIAGDQIGMLIDQSGQIG